MANPTVFVLGYGNNIGSSVALKFKNEGFNVAVASRSVDPSDVSKLGYHGIKLDLEKIHAIHHAFEEVEKIYGPPSVVVYNAARATSPPGGPSDPFSSSYEQFEKDLDVTGASAYEAARLAIAAFDKLPEGSLRAFIATGNSLPWTNRPQWIGLSAGKRVLANIVEAGATAYGANGKRFYFPYEVSLEGGPVYPPNGPAHAAVFYNLYSQTEQGPWATLRVDTRPIDIVVAGHSNEERDIHIPHIQGMRYYGDCPVGDSMEQEECAKLENSANILSYGIIGHIHGP
ncbi:hypothetical protein FRB99_005512 [Tulasnella sp. 403]|nr:hypothetical protein FRB99_005512 [Tulasnella sp. 403]